MSGDRGRGTSETTGRGRAVSRALAAALGVVWLGCGSEGPDPSAACALLEERWESPGQLQVVGCRRLAAAPDTASGGYALELELDLEVLADTQIFPRGPL